MTPKDQLTPEQAREGSTLRPWTLAIEMEGEDGLTITIPEIGRCLHDWEWADAKEWDRDLANAELIVTAVNQRSALLERIKQLEEALSMTICHGCENRIGWNVPHESGLSTGLSARVVSTRTDWAKCPNCKRQRAALKGDA